MKNIENILQKIRNYDTTDPNRSVPITKEETMILHRHLWNWIADESERRSDYLWKDDYMREFDLERTLFDIEFGCWACVYVRHTCTRCPVRWHELPDENGTMCRDTKSPYYRLSEHLHQLPLETYISLAREIADLPAA